MADKAGIVLGGIAAVGLALLWVCDPFHRSQERVLVVVPQTTEDAAVSTAVETDPVVYVERICGDVGNPCEIKDLYQQFYDRGNAVWSLYKHTYVYVSGTIASRDDKSTFPGSICYQYLSMGKSHSDDIVPVVHCSFPTSWLQGTNKVNHLGKVKLACKVSDRGLSEDDPYISNGHLKDESEIFATE